MGFWCVFGLTVFLVGPGSSSRFDAAPSAVDLGDKSPQLLRVFLVYLLVVLPFILDQLMVQVMSPSLSGDYAALSTLGKLVFFGSAPVITVLFPYMASQRPNPERQFRYFLVGSALTLAIAGLGVVLLWLAPAVLIERLFSVAYRDVSSHLGEYAVGMFAYVASYLMVHLCLARGHQHPVVPLALTVVVQLILFSLWHDTLGALVADQLVTYGTQCALLLLYLLHGALTPPPQRGANI